MCSVKYVYHLLKNKCETKALGPFIRSQGRIWKRIWNAPIHTRIQNFQWRLVKNIIPTCGNLVRKCVKTIPECLLCHGSGETADHIFFHCQSSNHVWFLSPLGLRVDVNNCFDYYLEKVFIYGDPLSAQFFGIILWKIWHHSGMIFKQSKFPPTNGCRRGKGLDARLQ